MYDCNENKNIEISSENIRIYSRQASYCFSKTEESKDFSTILITGHEERLHFDSIKENSDKFLHLMFDDIIEPSKVWPMVPTEKDVESALTFVEENRIIKLQVVCMAGVSRSAGIAFCIATKLYGLDNGIKILNPRIHWPNRKIVELGSKILNEPKMLVELEKFYRYSKRFI